MQKRVFLSALLAALLSPAAFAWFEAPRAPAPLSAEERAAAARQFADWQRRHGAPETPVPSAPQAAPAPAPRPEAPEAAAEPQPVPAPAAEAAPPPPPPAAPAKAPAPSRGSFFRRPINPDRAPIRHESAPSQW